MCSSHLPDDNQASASSQSRRQAMPSQTFMIGDARGLRVVYVVIGLSRAVSTVSGLISIGRQGAQDPRSGIVYQRPGVSVLSNMIMIGLTSLLGLSQYRWVDAAVVLGRSHPSTLVLSLYGKCF